jgi:ubiquinone/menaquinone biosynthesis C-methylase UbiE
MTSESPELERWSYKSASDIVEDHRELADEYEKQSWLMHLLSGRYRERQFSTAEGRVLEVACGIGENFRYLPEALDVVAVDISPDMLAKAQTEANDLRHDIDLHRMNAHDLPLADDSFETVVSSFSTCTFPKPFAALAEMGRVCKPDGQVLLLEHGKSDPWPLAKLQERRADSKYENEGCRLWDDPVEVVRQSELAVEDFHRWFLGYITGITARPTG